LPGKKKTQIKMRDINILHIDVRRSAGERRRRWRERKEKPP